MNAASRSARRLLSAAAVTAGLVGAVAVSAGTATARPPVCTSAVGPADAARIAELADVTADPPAEPLAVLRDHVDRLWQITNILVAGHDRRGIFALGLAAIERDAVLPLESTPGALNNPRWAQLLSVQLLDRYLAAVHDEFTGAPVAAHWRQYFALASNCAVSGQRAAMAGYNSHITVDLAYAVAAARSTTSNASDFFTIVDTIAAHGNSIVTATNRAYGVDLGPVFRFYFVGDSLDLIAGKGTASTPLLRAADVGYNVVTWNNGLALENPRTRPAAAATVRTLWSTGSSALTVAQGAGILR